MSCECVTHRLWPLQGGSLRLLSCQLQQLNKHINTQYSGKVTLASGIKKSDVFWAGLATHIHSHKINIGGYCRRSCNGKQLLVHWLQQSTTHALCLGFMAAMEQYQTVFTPHEVDDTVLQQLPLQWWHIPKWLESTDGLLQHQDYMQPLIGNLRKGHQCAYCVSVDDLPNVWGLDWKKGHCIWVDRFATNWTFSKCSHSHEYHHVRHEDKCSKFERYKLPDKMMR